MKFKVGRIPSSQKLFGFVDLMFEIIHLNNLVNFRQLQLLCPCELKTLIFTMDCGAAGRQVLKLPFIVENDCLTVS